ncbi:MAG: 4Fe-4S binding protein [Candidatus Hodarchaeota archaeon]
MSRNASSEKNLGVFVCRCGKNIAATVDVNAVVEQLRKYSDVVHSEEYVYMCSDPGQKLLENAIQKHRLNGVVVACCSPTLHEETFRNASERVRLNRYLCEIANIREKCSWVHSNKKEATNKAIKITKSMVDKVRENVPLIPVEVPVGSKCLIIGGGIAGIQAALDVADAGQEVILVEREPSVGGRMAQLSETFPTLDCSSCILTPKMSMVAHHPRIKLLTSSEIVEFTGYVGNFKVKIRRKPSYVDEEKCTLCDDCSRACPITMPNEFNRGLSPRKAIYIPFPQAVPAVYTLDAEHCLGFDLCGKCNAVCEPEAINYEAEEEIIEEEVGAVILATGYDQYALDKLPEYLSDDNPDIIGGLEFERMLSASGPTGGVIKRPSDLQTPKTVVFIQCSGSRDPEHHNSYCSKICCMYTAKQALLYKHAVHEGEAYVFYIDIRAQGKDYEEFVNRVMEEERINYIRGKVSKIFRKGDKTIVWGADTLAGKAIEIEADMVVLAQAVVPKPDTQKIANLLKIQLDPSGFLKEAHPKLRPVDTIIPGIFIAGAIQAPKDIPETVAQASGAASKALAILKTEKLTHDPGIAAINTDLCTKCGICADLCPYGAIKVDNLVQITDVLCEGCGTCVGSCPSGAARLTNMTDSQVAMMIETLIRSE